jgi:hypothetical protein
MDLPQQKEGRMTAALMSPDHRLVLLYFVYDTNHLMWLYRSAIDSSPSTLLTSEHMCLVDFAGRAVALARSLIDDDNRRRDTRAGFKPSPSALRDQLRASLAARRRALQQHAASAATTAPPPDHFLRGSVHVKRSIIAPFDYAGHSLKGKRNE